MISIVGMCATLLDAGTSANHHEGIPMSIPGTAREAVEASADKAQDLDASDRFRPQGIRPRDRRVTASPASSLTP